MSQQINLLNLSLIKKKELLSPTNIAISLGFLSALMLVYYSFAQSQLSSLTIQRKQVAETLSATQTQLTQTALLHAPHEADAALLDQIAQLEQKEKIQQQVLQTVSKSATTPDKGYAALMRAFAKQSIEGLWLTSFSMDSDNNQLNISGRALQGELVPEYISRLGNEDVLKGQSFATLNISLPKVEVAAPNNTSVQPTPSSGSATASSGKPISADDIANQVPQANFIEFSLQSSHQESSSNALELKAGRQN
ncbi:MAG: PilN domain-containing protein [Methylotenera sp.]|nr:PilN domain-containing protein [Methylotenera sp.]NOS96012.1 PilN domain-containing protein [Methylotenera sp.]